MAVSSLETSHNGIQAAYKALLPLRFSEMTSGCLIEVTLVSAMVYMGEIAFEYDISNCSSKSLALSGWWMVRRACRNCDS